MTGTRHFSLDELIVHRPPMRMIDEIISISDTEAVAAVAVGSRNIFVDSSHGLPAYCGIEMMAQTIAAIDGLRNLNKHLQPRIGFLLGSRKYTPKVAYFAVDTQLLIHVKMVFSDGQMFSFEGAIEVLGDEIAHATLNVFSPHNPEAFLNRSVA